MARKYSFKLIDAEIPDNFLNRIELVLIIGISLIPLFFNFPYRVNIFLSWEGAYRLSIGQIPYRDFGIPVGFVFWVIPALFFKIFGPYLITLIKAQVFINIISGLAFRSILKSLKVNEGIRTLSILVYCLSFSFINFWPWYNHTVFVFQFISISFLLQYMLREKKYLFTLILSSFFAFISFFTKQDGGALGFIVCFVILIYYCLHEKNYRPILIFSGSFFITGLIFILPFLQYNFGYWFNYGQPPNNSRLSAIDFLTEIMGGSDWEKFYFFLVIMLAVGQIKNGWKQFFDDKTRMIFTLLTVGIITEALIIQVTSYVPVNNNIFFHSFAIAYLLTYFKPEFKWKVSPIFALSFLLIIFWWSGTYWNYLNRMITRVYHINENPDYSKISKRTYVLPLKEVDNIDISDWEFSDMKAFKGIYMPKSTVDGMKRLKANPLLRNNPEVKVLNMTELTPLEYEIPYSAEKGRPLWFHKGVSIFAPQIEQYCNEIKNGYYDIVLFEEIPYLNNFYPEAVRDSLIKYYEQTDRFLAPRMPTKAYIEVYERKTDIPQPKGQ